MYIFEKTFLKMSKGIVRYGFLIKGNEVYDTKILSYKLTKEVLGSNIVYQMNPTNYKRLHIFESLLYRYDIDKVFELLRFNKHLEECRKKESVFREEKLQHASNMAVIYNYPPTYLTGKKFSLYKIAQELKKRLE